MRYINTDRIEAARPLVEAYYRFPRRRELDENFSKVVSNYFLRLAIGKPFEARGLLVTGESRVGKTKEILTVIEAFNREGALLSNGQKACFVHCTLLGPLSWKDLGIRLLEALHYPMRAQRSQAQIWGMVFEQAKLQGVIGIVIDEAQHVFSEKGNTTDKKLLDGFKALLKDQRWPLCLILAGVPELRKHVHPYRQLNELLFPVHFDLIDPKMDITELNNLVFAFGDAVEIDFTPLSNNDFFQRLIFACARRWGLVIELVIEALTLCRMDSCKTIDLGFFERALAARTSMALGYSPFTVDDYQNLFSNEKMLELLAR